MKRLSIVLATMAGGICLCVYPALAQRGGGRGGPPPGAGMPSQAQGSSQRSPQGGGRPATEARMGQTAKAQAPTQVATQLERNPGLSTRLAPLVPQGMTLADAATGFKNQGQFVAALHVAQNLGIPFADLKARMTGENPISLGKTIQELRPEMPSEEVQVTVKRAETQAQEDVREARRTK
jgi:hypothetical protein